MPDTSISARIAAISAALVSDYGDDLGDVPHAIWPHTCDLGEAYVAAQALEVTSDAALLAMADGLLIHAQRIAHNARAVMAQIDRRNAA